MRGIAEEAKEILGDCLDEEGRPLTFAELEEECIEAGDLLTSAVLGERVAERQPPEEAPACPTCRRPGERERDDEARALQTERGEAAWLEPVYYCRRCRRSFFPSLG